MLFRSDIEQALTIVETNYHEHRMTVTEACRLADRVITVHMKRAYPSGWEVQRDAKFQEFVQGRLLKKVGGHVFNVKVDD